MSFLLLNFCRSKIAIKRSFFSGEFFFTRQDFPTKTFCYIHTGKTCLSVSQHNGGPPRLISTIALWGTGALKCSLLMPRVTGLPGQLIGIVLQSRFMIAYRLISTFHSDKLILKLAKLYRIWNVITLFQLLWQQTEVWCQSG